MPLREEILSANERYARDFDKSEPPSRHFAVVTCMDRRLDPVRFLGLEDGGAYVIRNAGGLVTDDALRSLVISHWLLGTREAVVIAHTDCGMLTFTNDVLHERLPPEGRDVDFLPFPDLEESVRSSLRRIRESPLLPDDFRVSGFVYDVHSGRLREVT